LTWHKIYNILNIKVELTLPYVLRHSKTQSDPPLIGFCLYMGYNLYMAPKHFGKVMHTPYFRMDQQVLSNCKCLECRIENFFIKFFKEKRKK